MLPSPEGAFESPVRSFYQLCTIHSHPVTIRFMTNKAHHQPLHLLLLLATTAGAQESHGRFELTPLVGYGIGGDFEDIDTGSELEFDEGGTFGLIFDIQADAITQWEVLYLQQSTELDTGELFVNQPILDVDLHYLHGGGTYVLEGDWVQPYVAGSLGLSRFDPSPSDFDSENYFSFSLGAGLRFLPSKRVGVRLEGRWFLTFVESDSEIFCRTGGATNVCAIRVEGSTVSQWHAFAGVTFRF